MNQQPSTPERALATIRVIESAPPFSMQFTPGRYPYTYAYDYMREHWADFGLNSLLSRGDCANYFRGNPDKDAICVLLADAYMRQYNIEKPQCHLVIEGATRT